MDLLANDLSIHGQFHDISSFRDALARLLAMRNAAHRFGREVYCNRALLTAKPMPDMTMQQTLGRLASNEQRAAMSWLTRGGPFWDDICRHGAGDYLESRGEVVTESAVGEAAFRMLHGVEYGLVSVIPSDWDYSPVEVTWRQDSEGLHDQSVTLENWRSATMLEERLRANAQPIRSWNELREVSTKRFENLTFTEDCFTPLLAGVPFAKSVAERILVLLDILDRLASAFDTNGVRTSEWHQIYQEHFTGERALFSDSSDAEKHDFHNELMFPNPDEPGKVLFCTWHGKVSHMTLRLHFSWPILHAKPVYVVYAGPKITKR